MIPRIETIGPKQLAGQRLTMSIANNLTGQLWGRFAPKIKDIPARLSSDKYSLQVYPPSYYEQFSPTTEFEKWALVAVDRVDDLPAGILPFTLPGGLYAVFDYKGSSADPSIFQHIFFRWLPESEYVVDDRPHFEVLGTNYRNNDPESEEEIWIPIRPRT